MPTNNAPPFEGYVEIAGGVRLWTWDTGGVGPAVVLAHPHSGNHASWDLQRAAYLTAGYRVVAYSRRGYYRSDRGPENAVGTQAGDMAAVMDKLGVGRALIVG